MNKNNSPYTASFTGGGFLLDETKLLLPLFLSDDREAALKDEALNNNVLMLNAESSRKRVIAEVKRRFEAVPRAFWETFLDKTEEAQKVANFFVILKTYQLIFDLHVNLAMKKWSSINHVLDFDDVMMEIEEIGANDEFVDSWAEATKKKVGSAYLTILKKVGLLDEQNTLHFLEASDETLTEYWELGEPWFFEFCLLPPYIVERIKPWNK